MSATTLPRPASAGRWAGNSRRLRSLIVGRTEDPAWARPALIAMLLATAIAYLINLTASGDANSFYAAAVLAGTKSWKAFFFGSIDPSNFITVDKPPASLWVMALSGRIFGFSSASMLVPQALEGVIAVGLLSATVKRWYGAGAGLLAGGLLALTPVAALMFRFNNPDALLVCLLVASAYCLVRALEHAGTRWLLAAGTLIGFAFLTKMMQAFLVLPGFALVYLLASPTTIGRRVGQLLAAGAAIVISAGWWVTIVALWPAASRPMIDGSSDNSILNLILGYNGLGRIFGSGGPSGGGGGAGGAGGQFSGSTGVLRLFNDVMGAQASWLLPAALLALAAGLWWTRGAPRTDRIRAGLVLWGGWLIVTGAVFSLGKGVIHTYYTVALAPAIAALVAIGASLAWRERERLPGRLLLAAGTLLSAGWAIALLQRTASWEVWLRPLIGASALMAAVLLLIPRRSGRAVALATATLAFLASLSGPLAYAAATIASPHTGSLPSAGPSSAQSLGGPGGAPGGPAHLGGNRAASSAGGATAPGGGDGTTSAKLVAALEAGASHYRWVAATSGSQNAATLELATDGDPVMGIGGFSGQGGNLTLAQFEAYVKAGDIHYYIASGTGFGGAGSAAGGTGPAVGGAGTGRSGAFPGTGGFAGPGARGAEKGLPTGTNAPPAATNGALAGIGGPPTGSTGTQEGPGAPGLPGGGERSSSLTTWVKAHYRAVKIGGQTVYDLTRPLSR